LNDSCDGIAAEKRQKMKGMTKEVGLLLARLLRNKTQRQEGQHAQDCHKEKNPTFKSETDLKRPAS
jgi:hypothetical protein